MRNAKYASTKHILTSVINTCKTSYILNATEQFILKAHDFACEKLSSTSNFFVTGPFMKQSLLFNKTSETDYLSFQLTLW